MVVPSYSADIIILIIHEFLMTFLYSVEIEASPVKKVHASVTMINTWVCIVLYRIVSYRMRRTGSSGL